MTPLRPECRTVGRLRLLVKPAVAQIGSLMAAQDAAKFPTGPTMWPVTCAIV